MLNKIVFGNKNNNVRGTSVFSVFSARSDSDYEPVTEASEESALQMIEQATEFLQETKDYFRNEIGQKNDITTITEERRGRNDRHNLDNENGANKYIKICNEKIKLDIRI